MTDRESGKGFEGLSGMVSNGTVPAVESAAPAKYSMISLAKNPSMAAPWSGDGQGEGWKWGDFYVTIQTSPETFFDFSAKMAGTKERWEGLSYHFSATVFRDPQKNEFGPSSRPVLVIAVEKSDFGTMVGVFDGDVRSNLGGYAGTLDVDSARTTFFDFIGKRFALVGEPRRLGTIEAVREKVVTRKVGEILDGGDSIKPAPSMAEVIWALPQKSKAVPIAAALVVFVTWGYFAKPSFLAFAFGYEDFEECVLHRMQGQPSNLIGIAQSACRKSNPPETLLDEDLIKIDFSGKNAVVTHAHPGTTVTKIETMAWEKDCQVRLSSDLPDKVFEARRSRFSDSFDVVPPEDKYKCFSFRYYGTVRN